MHELEDELKRQNWLSVLTFDVYKYQRAGGVVRLEWSADGLAVHLPGVAPDTPGLNSKLALVASGYRDDRASAVAAPAAPEEPPQ